MSRKTVSRLGFSTLIRRIASVFNVEKSLGRTSSAAVTRRIHAVPWLRTSETPGIERSWASSTASLVSSSTKSDWTRALRAVEDRCVGISHGPQGPRPIGLRRTRDERGRGRGPAPFNPWRLRGPEPGNSMDPPGHRGRGGPPQALLDVEDGRDPADQRGEAKSRDRLPRHHGQADRSGGNGRARLSQVLRDHAEGEAMSTETTHARVTGRPLLSERRSVSQRSQFTGLYARELLRTFRNPWVLVITFVQPFMWLAFFGSSFSGASQ